MMNLRLKMVLTMKWLIVMMRVMIQLTPTHMKIIFSRCNAIVFYFAPVSIYIFFICAYLFTLNCRLLDKDGGRLAEEEEVEEEKDGGGGIAGRRCPTAGQRRPAADGTIG
jgi:hypothetical protein